MAWLYGITKQEINAIGKEKLESDDQKQTLSIIPAHDPDSMHHLFSAPIELER